MFPADHNFVLCFFVFPFALDLFAKVTYVIVHLTFRQSIHLMFVSRVSQTSIAAMGLKHYKYMSQHVPANI